MWSLWLQVQKKMVMSSFRLMWFAFDAYFKGCVNIVIDGAWIKERVPGGCCISGFSGYGLGPVLRRCSGAWQVVTTVHSKVSLTDISFCSIGLFDQKHQRILWCFQLVRYVLSLSCNFVKLTIVKVDRTLARVAHNFAKALKKASGIWCIPEKWATNFLQFLLN